MEKSGRPRMVSIEKKDGSEVWVLGRREWNGVAETEREA